MAETTISSPGPSTRRAYDWATRLMASVVPRTKTISRASRALMNRRTVSRAASYALVARSLRRWTPRWMFALSLR